VVLQLGPRTRPGPRHALRRHRRLTPPHGPTSRSLMRVKPDKITVLRVSLLSRR
jgi:hypothetical protein